MEKTKVVTFRIEESMLEKIDEIVKTHHYYKRSNVIESGLKLVFALEEKGLLGRLLSYHPRYDDVTKLEFEVRRKVLR